jgi:hypothetical protein
MSSLFAFQKENLQAQPQESSGEISYLEDFPMLNFRMFLIFRSRRRRCFRMEPTGQGESRLSSGKNFADLPENLNITSTEKNAARALLGGRNRRQQQTKP